MRRFNPTMPKLGIGRKRHRKETLAVVRKESHNQVYDACVQELTKQLQQLYKIEGTK